jgi:hypothetical protein
MEHIIRSYASSGSLLECLVVLFLARYLVKERGERMSVCVCVCAMSDY